MVAFFALSLFGSGLVMAQTAEQPPAKPTGLKAETKAGSLDVDVSWDEVAGADSYKVRWRLGGPGNPLNDGVSAASASKTITVDDYGDWVVRVQACAGQVCGQPAAERFEVEPAAEEEPAVEAVVTETVEPEEEPAEETAAATVETLEVRIVASPGTTIEAGELVTLSAAVDNAPAGSPSYVWQIDWGYWMTVDTGAVFTYLTNGTVTETFRLTITYPTGETASNQISIAWVEPTETAEDVSEAPDRALKTLRAATTDYDTDDDGLIEIDSAAKLAVVQHDLNGDGTVDDATNDQTAYDTAYPNALAAMGCKDTNNDSSPGPCIGYELTADITLTGSWTPIGNISTSICVCGYTAKYFEGNGHTISGLSINQNGFEDVGFFREIESTATVRNLGFISPTVQATTVNVSNARAGILAGWSGSNISQVYISGGSVTMTTNQSNNRVGSLTGSQNGGGIDNVWSTASVTTDHSTNRRTLVGGLVGDTGDSANITNSYYAGLITTGNQARTGGLTASVGQGSSVFTGSYWDTTVSTKSSSAAGTGKTTAQMKALDADGFGTGHKFIFAAGQYPRLDFEKPFVPAGFAVVGGVNSVIISWDDPDNDAITKYQYSTDNKATWTDITDAAALRDRTYTVTGLTPETNYNVNLRAVNSYGRNGDASEQLAALTRTAPTPRAPKSLAAAVLSCTSVQLTWTTPSALDNEGLTGYEYSFDGSTWTALALADVQDETLTSSHTFVGISHNTAHTIRLRGVNAHGAGTASSVSATTPKCTHQIVEFISTPASSQNNHYISGDEIQARITFPANVDVVGSPKMKIQLGANGGQKLMSLVSGQTLTNIDSLTFSYTVTYPGPLGGRPDLPGQRDCFGVGRVDQVDRNQQQCRHQLRQDHR